MGAVPADALAGHARAYISGSHCAHLVQVDGAALCGALPRGRRRWLGIAGDGYEEKAAARRLCCSCRRYAEVLRQLAGRAPGPGVTLTVVLSGRTLVVSECAACGKVRPVHGRGLCLACWSRHRNDGTLGDWGYVRADRLADFRAYRERGLSVAEAAARVEVSVRTAERYERDLRQAREAA